MNGVVGRIQVSVFVFIINGSHNDCSVPQAKHLWYGNDTVDPLQRKKPAPTTITPFSSTTAPATTYLWIWTSTPTAKTRRSCLALPVMRLSTASSSIHRHSLIWIQVQFTITLVWYAIDIIQYLHMYIGDNPFFFRIGSLLRSSIGQKCGQLEFVRCRNQRARKYHINSLVE